MIGILDGKGRKISSISKKKAHFFKISHPIVGIFIPIIPFSNQPKRPPTHHLQALVFNNYLIYRYLSVCLLCATRLV
jgi:hypothetical protein